MLTLCLSLLPTAAFAESTGEAAQETRRDPAVGDVYTVGEDTVVQNEEVRNAAVQAAHVDHPICGDADCTDHGDTLTGWVGVSDLSKITTAGNYYLTAPVELTAQWKPVDGVVLCLNGYSISRSGTDSSSNSGVIGVGNGVNFTLTDCDSSGKITHTDSGTGRGVYVYGGGTFNMYGGAISGNTYEYKSSFYSASGGGVFVDGDKDGPNGTFHMYGGTISDNNVIGNYGAGGGGVSVEDYASFYLHDGTITGNTVTSDAIYNYGGGVEINKHVYFTMESGTISGNTVTASNSANGGGIFADDSSVLDLSGGTITGNTADSGAGMQYYRSTVNLSGDITITGNATSAGIASNVFVRSGMPLTVAGELQNTIGVKTERTPTADRSVQIAVAGENYALKEADKNHFVYDLEGNCLPVYHSEEQAICLEVQIHEHPICGATHTNINGHTGECSNVKWTAWNGVSDITYDENNTAYIYLTTNAERTSTLEIAQGNTLYLCLNGHSITTNKSSSVVTVGNDATFSLCDCKDGGKLTHGMYTSSSRYSGHGVHLTGSKGTFNMYGGNITGNRASYGGGVTIDKEYSNATFNLYGGSITDNATTGGDGGGGVHALFGTFTMYGGSITGNNAENAKFGGGGVYAGSRTGKFYMKGGSITGNTAKNGGGVYVYQSSEFYVSGSVDITGNKNTLGIDENVYLRSGAYFVVNADLNADAKIGVTYAGTIASGAFVTIAKGANKGYTEGNITSDQGSDYTIKREGDDVNLYYGLHEHCICGGDTCTGVGHTCDEKVTFKAWSGASGKLPTESGYYYLTDNMTLTTEWEPPEGSNIVLCLNGKTITAKVGTQDSASMTHNSIDLRTGVTVSVTDCVGTGKISRSTYYQRAVNVWGGTFNLYGGKITGFKADATSGGGVAITNRGIFNMYGGAITNNTSSYGGGGVYVGYFNNSVGTFNMHGGSITGNTSYTDGAGVRVSSNSSMTISGNVKITGNIKDRNNVRTANNVYLPRNKTITVTGPLTGGASSIGVTTTDLLKDGCFIAIANGTDSYTLTDNEKDAFSEDEGSRFNSKLLRGNTLLLTRFVDIPMHEHALCGASCNHEDARSSELWQPLTYYSSTQELYCGPAEANRSTDSRYTADNTTRVSYYSYTIPSGNYYLTEDLKLGGDGSSITGGVLMIEGDVKLCLNGKTLSTTTTAYLVNVIKVDVGGSLTLCDCSTDGSGKVTSENKVYTCVQPLGGQNTGKKSGKFTMYGGTLTGAYYGVALNDADSVALYGGTITGNTMGVSANYPVTIGGTVNITGNTNADVRLYNKNSGTGLIKIDPSLTQDSRIGVSSEQELSETIPSVKIATGAQDGVDYTEIFTPDVTDYTVTKDGTTLYLSAHTHVWSYTVSENGKTITATCTANGCNLPNQSGGSVTIVAPDKNTLTYDGNTKEATLEGALTTGVTLPDIKYYYKIGEQEYQLETGAKPTNAKSYRAEITVGGVNASVSYEIKKATPQASDFLFSGPNDPTYDGNPKTATVTSTKIDADHIKVKYYQGETVVERPTEAGTYTVKIDVTESTNYKATTDLTADDWKFTILQAEYSGAKSNKTIDIVKGRGTAQTGSLTAADFFPEGTELPADAKIASVSGTGSSMGLSVMPQSDGTLKYTSGTGITATENESYTVTISTTNYRNFTVTLTFRPVDKQPQKGFKFAGVENDKVTKTYGDDDFKIEATGQVNGSNVTGFDSSNENVATVANDGTVTIKGAGTAVIKATASATDDYAQGVATYELTVSPKTLTADDLEFTQSSIFTKTYDGDTACTTATVQIKDSAKVTSGDELPTVTGTYAYNSKDVKDATKVTFTSAASDNTNYILPEGLTVENAANITKRVLTVGKVDTISKTYNTLDNALDCVTGIELIGTVSGETLRFYTSAETGGDYGIYETKFDNANAGQNKTITGTVALLESSALASNYTFKVDGKESSTAPFTATGEITPADGGSKGDVERTQKFMDGDPKTETIAWKQLLPAGQTWNYVSEYYSASSVTVDHRTDDNGALTYTITGGKENDVVVFTVSAKCNNYNDFTYTVRVTLTARDSQALEFKGVENGKVTKTYGNQPFTQTVTGEKTDVTYASSNERVATVDNDGKVTIVGAGDTTITATAAQTNDYASASASYTLTVNKLRIAVPAPGKNKLEYDGTTQTYMPDRLDTAYCTITDNTAKDVRANNAHYTATVSLNDKANTEWDIATENDTSNQTYDFWITPATAIVTALDKKITTGQSAPALANAKLGEDYTITGLYGSDSLGSIVLYYADPSNTATEVNPDTSKAGTYAIVAAGGTGNPNYAPTFHTGTLTIANRPSSGGGAVTYPVSIPDKVENGSVSSDVKNASKGSTVTITIKPEDGFKLANLTVIDKDGNKLEIADKGDGKYTFIMPAGKVEVKASFTKEVETSPFADVATDAYYYEAVKWAAEQGITGGTGSGLFSPDYTCTRAQIVTFLWRAAGSPEPKAMSGFSDIPENSYYAKAVAWAVENGITVGTSSTTFSPEATCTRAQSVTFLFRAAKASTDGTPAFSDVTANAYYAEAVKWATDNGITNGIGGGLFGSNNDCTRAQIVTFLWRLYAGK